MNEIKCEVIRDLLPLYEDNAASEKTAQLVREHLKDCPDCREELRKMRTPISMPPDEDEEAVKRFLEYRAEVRRKQNRKIACVASVLAVFIVFCLCYTLIPRSWDQASRGADPDRIMGTYSEIAIQFGESHAEIRQINDEHSTDSTVVSAFMDALRAEAYRAELRNVMNYTPLAPLFQNGDVKGAMCTVNLYLVQDNEIVASAMLYDDHSHTIHVWAEGNPNTFFYHVDGKVYDTLAALMREYGE